MNNISISSIFYGTLLLIKEIIVFFSACLLFVTFFIPCGIVMRLTKSDPLKINDNSSSWIKVNKSELERKNSGKQY